MVLKTAAVNVKKKIMRKVKTKTNKRIPAPTKKAMELFPEPSKTDVNGSYTGRPQNKKEVPVQDADDL